MPPATNVITVSDAGLEKGLRAEFDRIKPNSDYVVDNSMRGIIYVGGGKYWPGIMVGIRLLRKLGCMLPVEIWYRDGVEEVYPEDVFPIPLVTLKPIKEKIGGWEAKLHALYYTQFAEVLYLDADAYCVKNPNPLFQLVSQENSFLYWKDLPSQANSIRWKAVYPEGATRGIPQVQGGHLLLHREYAWKLVHTAKYMCDHSDYYFKRMYGDQDTWRVALAGNICNYLCLGKAEWDRVTFKCYYDNEVYILHRCKGKLYEPKYIPQGNKLHANPHYDLPLELEVFELFGEYVNRRDPLHTEVFDAVYRNDIWGSSGKGSTLKEARPFVEYMNNLIESKGYKSIVDVGCGNGVVGSMIKCSDYLGYDCSEKIIVQNKKQFPTKAYKQLDISTDFGIIDSSDVLLCKDVLHHWPSETLKRFLDEILMRQSVYKMWKAVVLCFDTHQLRDGQDCHAGGYRALSLDMEPLKKYGLKFDFTYMHKGIVTII